MIHVYHGDGKGKTTAAMGLALRMLAAGRRVVVVQFLKDGESGEARLLAEHFGVPVIAGKVSDKFTWSMTSEELAATCELHDGNLASALAELEGAQEGLLVLDEALDALSKGLVDEALVDRALDMSARGAFIEIISDIPEYCTVIFIYDLVAYKRDGKMKKLVAALDEHVREVEFCQQERDQLLRWMKRRFAAEGHDIDTATADHLLFTCGTLMTDLVPEIGKIAAYAKGERITVADINAVADPILDAQVFDMTNSITAGKYDDAARVLGELLRMQTEPIVILAAVGRELRRLYTARMALDGGKDRLWLKQLWNMSSDYPAKLLMQAARKVDHDWCRTAVLRCQQLDRRMKSMSMPDKQKEDELKLFLMELAGRR